MWKKGWSDKGWGQPDLDPLAFTFPRNRYTLGPIAMDHLFSISRNEPLRAALGRKGEHLAADFLIRNGFRIVMSNFTVPVGRNMRGAEVTGEIDLIALEAGTICFVEVKTRRSDELFEPTANVNLRKQRQITRTARIYRRLFNLAAMPYRYDVVSIVLPHDGPAAIELVRSFWNDSKFNKRIWNREIYADFV